jgi:uroporphyrinogen decarboxylase
MSDLGFNVFNFSHTIDIAEAQAKMPGIALMGNVPPLDVLVRGTPDQATTWARDCITKTAGRGLILSAGGGVSPDTPPAMLDALVGARHSYPSDPSTE